MKMVALGKFNYGTRRLKAGDEFEPNLGNRDLMISLNLARELPDELAPVDLGDLEIWREHYRTMFGRPPDGRWGIDRIRREIKK